MTAEQQAIVKRLGSRAWRLAHLYWIEDEGGNKVPFRPTAVQRMFYSLLHWLSVVLKARQVRISTACLIYALDLCLFRTNQTAGIIDKTDLDAQKKLARIKFAYDHLDDPDGGQEAATVGAFVKRSIRPRLANKHELHFTNDSKIWAGTSLRGGTVQFLWITEFGYIASETPDKAKEIAAGALNTVHKGNLVVVESTHEGGRYGLNYELIRRAQKSPAQPNAMQWRLMFFAWHQNPDYTLPLNAPLQLTQGEAKYFAELQKLGVRLSDEQKNWYVHKSRTPGIDMQRQFPGTAEEALRAQTEGAIYGSEMALLRAKGRICDFMPNAHAPLLTSWDIGVSDYCAVWLVQLVGLERMVLDYYCANGRTPAQHAAQMLLWERHYGRPIARHFMPHDADKRENSLKTMRDLMREAGIANVTVVPRTGDLWASINLVRAFLLSSWIHGTACEVEAEDAEGNTMPTGIACLEGYKKKVEAVGGRIVEIPVHNEASHGADALRTIAEAQHMGMVKDYVSQQAAHMAGTHLAVMPQTPRRSIMGRRGSVR